MFDSKFDSKYTSLVYCCPVCKKSITGDFSVIPLVKYKGNTMLYTRCSECGNSIVSAYDDMYIMKDSNFVDKLGVLPHLRGTLNSGNYTNDTDIYSIEDDLWNSCIEKYGESTCKDYEYEIKSMIQHVLCGDIILKGMCNSSYLVIKDDKSVRDDVPFVRLEDLEKDYIICFQGGRY